MVPIFVRNLINPLAIADQCGLTPLIITSMSKSTHLILPKDSVESLMLCQELDNFDSGSSSDIPLATGKHLVNQQRSVRSKTGAYRLDDEPDQRSSKRKAQTFLRELFG